MYVLMFKELKDAFMREFPDWELDTEGFEVMTFTKGDKLIRMNRQRIGVRFRVESLDGTVIGQDALFRPFNRQSLHIINKYL